MGQLAVRYPNEVSGICLSVERIAPMLAAHPNPHGARILELHQAPMLLCFPNRSEAVLRCSECEWQNSSSTSPYVPTSICVLHLK
jgi:hypothetical protein